MGKVKKSLSVKSLARKAKVSADEKKIRDNGPQTRSETDGNAVLDRRFSGDRRKAEDRRKVDVPVATERRQLARREKVSRRRQIDPTTCERNYTPDEIEFMTALEGYKRTSGRMFPTCSEVLEVLRNLGYEKRPIAEPAGPLPTVDLCAPAAVVTVPIVAMV